MKGKIRKILDDKLFAWNEPTNPADWRRDEAATEIEELMLEERAESHRQIRNWLHAIDLLQSNNRRLEAKLAVTREVLEKCLEWVEEE